MSIAADAPDVLVIEPFYGGSHKVLTDLLLEQLSSRALLVSASDKKWHWRARTSALFFAEKIPAEHSFRFLFASSVLNLAELIALRSNLAKCRKVLYFHENQLNYPAQEEKERDFQYGYNQILSALVADVVVFNSHFNMSSFLDKIDAFIKKIPSARPKCSQSAKIRPKCRVLYFPLKFPTTNPLANGIRIRRSVDALQHIQESGCAAPKNGLTKSKARHKNTPLHIVWPHRWEHDKDPDFFVSVLEELRLSTADFIVSIVGQQFSETPDSLAYVGRKLSSHIKHWGFLPSKEDYYEVLRSADVVVSTAVHEFFGVAILEAVHFGCFPLVPRRLVYPELYPDECLYDPTSTAELTATLLKMSRDVDSLRQRKNLQWM